MLKKNNFFKSYFTNSKKYKINLQKTQKIYNSLLLDIKEDKIPLLKTFEKNYELDYSKGTVKRFSKYKNIIIIGMGGSILGAKSIHSFLKTKIKKEVFFFDNLDPNLNYEYKKIKNLKNSCFIVISKSGNTLETVTNLATIFSKKILKNRLVIITEIKDNTLLSIATKLQAEIIEHKEFVGGRYSVLSETGMFPAALMKLNLLKFKNLSKLIKKKNFVNILIKNVASIYTLNSSSVKNSVVLNYDSNFNDLGYWYQQLVAESLGKKGKGINPTLSFGPKDHHSLLQLYLDGPKDKFFTFFSSSKANKNIKIFKNVISDSMSYLKNKSLKSIINAQCNAVKKIFKLKKIPFRQFVFKNSSEEELVEIFTFFVLETILLSRLMNVNAFDQPAVEQVKIKTKKILGR